MKKALAGPAKRTAKKLPERRAMIAAARRRAMVARVRVEAFTRAADRRLNVLLVKGPRVEGWTRTADRRLNRMLVRAWPRLAAVGRKVRAACTPWLRWLGRRLRPVAVLLLRVFSWVERRLRRLAALTVAGTKRLWAFLSFERVICAAIIVAALALIASQFVEYRSVEIGQPGYAGLPSSAAPPTVSEETAGQAHSFLLIPVALLAAALALVALRRKRWRLGRVVFLLGLVSLAVILLVDLPAGQDAGPEEARFSGATAVLEDGFYIELAAAIGLIIGGLLYYAGPCRTRTNSFARVASALRRRRRRRVSSRARAARRPSPRRSAEVSAPASRP
jgi:hypothetical protein